MFHIKKVSQAAAAVVAAVCSVVMLEVGYYSSRIPDSIMGDGSLPSFSTALPVSAVRNGCVAADISVRLFGSVPIKDIKEDKVERPKLIAGGEAFGIKLITDGVMIIDMKKLSGECPAAEAGLKVGDVIESVNGEEVYSNSQVSDLIKSSGGSECRVKYRRGEQQLECTVTPVLNEGCYRAGMWVRDSSAGIGTMTFIDPQTGIFAGLGHSVCDADTHEPLPLSHGTISPVRINGLKKGAKGEPGQLMGEFSGGDCGELLLNCDGGVYGSVDSIPENGELYPLAFSYEVHPGEAYILTQTDSGEPRRFDIVIEEVSAPGSGHDLVISAADPKLIEEAGGIVQGMSGSPIIQDGRLAGAVTHVFIDDPTGGYGIFAERMYKHSLAAGEEQQSAEEKAG
ncbi:MAG: SpoIVB peptidase [Ruminococcus sp.]|nr:SpoIVB peptidase [Ruminococcus sp.]